MHNNAQICTQSGIQWRNISWNDPKKKKVKYVRFEPHQKQVLSCFFYSTAPWSILKHSCCVSIHPTHCVTLLCCGFTACLWAPRSRADMVPCEVSPWVPMWWAVGPSRNLIFNQIAYVINTQALQQGQYHSSSKFHNVIYLGNPLDTIRNFKKLHKNTDPSKDLVNVGEPMPILVIYHHLGAPHRSQQVLQRQPKQAGKYRNILCNIVHILNEYYTITYNVTLFYCAYVGIIVQFAWNILELPGAWWCLWKM